MTTLSVLMPVYNAAPYLGQAIDSLLQQDRPADQIVIINDGSTDDSLQILERYARAEQRIELHSTANGGVSKARNLGLAHCKGDFIALMDADDRSLPARFEQQLAAMERLRLDVCGCALRTFGRKERTVVYPADDSTLKANYLFYGRTIPGPAAMLRGSTIADIRFDESLRFAEDFGFFLSMMLQTPDVRLHNIDQPLYAYRVHAAQASQRLAAENQGSLSQLLHTWLPAAGITASHEQLASHYRLWHERQPLSGNELEGYLPLMSQLCDWLRPHAERGTTPPALWRQLAQLNARDAHALARIAEHSGIKLPLWQRLAARLRSSR